MAEETTLPAEQASVEPLDEIANLLSGELEEDANEETTDDSDDSNDEETPPEESTEETDVEEGEEGETSEEEPTWASSLDVDESQIKLDDEGNIAGINIKIDGEESTVGLKDLIKGFQSNKSNTHMSQTLAAERKEFESARGEAVDTYTKKLSDVSKLAEYMHRTLTGEFESLDWQGIRNDNPAEYAALQADFNKRNTEIQQIYAAIESERGEQSTADKATAVAGHQKLLTTELAKVIENNPKWVDSTVRAAAMNEISAFTSETYSFSTDEVKSISDSRYIEILKDAMAYRKGLKVTKKKVLNKLPKYQKTKVGSKTRKVSRLDKLTKASKAAKGSNKRDLQTAAVAELITGG